MTVEELVDCIERYEELKRINKIKDITISSQIITSAKPLLVPIERGDYQTTKLWSQYMKLYHPRGYNGSIGRNIKFFVIDKYSEEYIGALSIGTPVYALEARDKFIGWTADQRIKKINKHIANNWRFLIFPNVNVKNLGSQILSQLNDCAKIEWKKRYGDTLVLLETFVDESECKGAGLIYKASSWYELVDNNNIIITNIDAKKMGLNEYIPARTKGHSFVIRRGVTYSDTLKGLSRTPKINTKKKIFLKPLHHYWRKTLMGD